MPITEENQRDFSVVLSHSKDIKDNKVPVSIELLVQLCTAAEQLFSGYTVKLAKALFTAVWAAYLCISEYSRMSDGNQHNLHRNAITVSHEGLSIKFLTDKTTKESRAFINTHLLVHKHVKISVDKWILETTRPQKHVKFLEQYIP